MATATANPSAMLAESLSEFSKAAYKAFSEVESQSRMEVARAMAEIREAKIERDKAYKELHATQMESQSWKQEVVTTKAALTQAELTIAHQAETLAVQVESIAQLRREVTQWKDQSKNWQEHFLRVEQERCSQLSRIDELIVEKLQYPLQRPNPATLFTPKGSKYVNGVDSVPSSSSKRPSDPSPIHPPAYKSAAPPSPQEGQNTVNSFAGTSKSNKRTNKGTIKAPKRRPQEQEPETHIDADREEPMNKDALTSKARKSNPNTVTSSGTQKHSDTQEAPTIRSSTIIRRVQAVINVKREESYDDEAPEEMAAQAAMSSSSTMKKKSESTDQHRYLRTPRRVIRDEDEEEEEEAAASLYGSGSGSVSVDPEDENRGPKTRYTNQERNRFRQRSRVNYRESEDDEDDEEEDELMMGVGDNHNEVYGTQSVEHDAQRSRKNGSQPAKKRKLATR